MPEMMTTQEVARYLRIKERKVYELAKEGRIPCRRVTGKWLFPKRLIDAWLSEGLKAAPAARVSPPPVVAGSHDPLLDWCLRESDCDLALLPAGSLDGLKRFAAGEALVCGLHVLDHETGEYNVPALRQWTDASGMVLIEWAWREQGLVLAAGNPLGIASLADLERKNARVVLRQSEAGSRILFDYLLAANGIDGSCLHMLAEVARSESDLALAVLEGRADAGLAVAAVARQHRLDFLPLQRERYDLLIRRHDYFEPPFQRLLAFTRTSSFAARVKELTGYDCSGLGRVVFNGP